MGEGTKKPLNRKRSSPYLVFLLFHIVLFYHFSFHKHNSKLYSDSQKSSSSLLFSSALLINPQIRYLDNCKNGRVPYNRKTSLFENRSSLYRSQCCPSGSSPSHKQLVSNFFLPSFRLYAKKNKKTVEEIDYSQYFEEEELEEGFFRGPVGPTPWEADIDISDPFMFDMDLDSDDDDYGYSEEDNYDSFDSDLGGEGEQEREMSMDVLPDDLDQHDSNRKNHNIKGKDNFNKPVNKVETEDLVERALRFYDHYNGPKEKERCFLLGVEKKRNSNDEREAFDEETQFSLEESLQELSDLVGTAGMEVIGANTQKVQDMNRRYVIGAGKVREVRQQMSALKCCTLIIDYELTPSQQMNLENAFGGEDSGIKILDRTALILDIFAQHAKTKEGQMQVELALNTYRLPRCTRLWTHLEKQSSGGATGGVGLRGPGETQLETDKRLLRKKISSLKKSLVRLQRHRTLHRVRRSKAGYPVIALVGYTNSGKSTLLNTLAQSGVLAENLLFATLDPTTRRVALTDTKRSGLQPEVLMTDTVGFIQKLPPHLVAAFRATLEEIYVADVLVHVCDISNPIWKKQQSAVEETLEDMGVSDKPRITFYNKVDNIQDPELLLNALDMEADETKVIGSAVTGKGLNELSEALAHALKSLMITIEAVIPFSEGELVNQIHKRGSCEQVEYLDSGTYMKSKVPSDLAIRLLPFRVDEAGQAYADKKEGAEIDWVALAKGRHEYAEQIKNNPLLQKTIISTEAPPFIEDDFDLDGVSTYIEEENYLKSADADLDVKKTRVNLNVSTSTSVDENYLKKPLKTLNIQTGVLSASATGSKNSKREPSSYDAFTKNVKARNLKTKSSEPRNNWKDSSPEVETAANEKNAANNPIDLD